MRTGRISTGKGEQEMQNQVDKSAGKNELMKWLERRNGRRYGQEWKLFIMTQVFLLDVFLRVYECSPVLGQ